MVKEKKYIIMSSFGQYDEWHPVLIVDTKEQAIHKVKEFEDNQPEYCEKYAEEVREMYDRLLYSDEGSLSTEEERIESGLKELAKKYPWKTDCVTEANVFYHYFPCEYEP